jgi:GntR family transcriptional repressor for pyruvate dehydrogenase complex
VDWEKVTTLRPPRLSEGVLDALQAIILSGELQPGDRLPPERKLAESFGVGRNSVREAIRQLATLGLVETHQGDGTFVSEASSQTLVRPFRSVLQLASATPQQVVQLRRILEPSIASLAASAADQTYIEKLTRAHERFEEAMRPGKDDPAEADTQFHQLIAEATGNPILAAIEAALMELLYIFRREVLLMEAYNPNRGPALGHQMILDAIKRGSSDGAAEAMRRHLDEVEKYRRTSIGRPDADD